MKGKNRIAMSAIGVLFMMLASMFLIPSGASANQFFSTSQNLFTDTKYMLQYPSVDNGNLWITASRSGLSAIVYKYNSNSLSLVTKTTLTNGEAECFTAQEYKGLLYIPAISNPGPYGSVTILNATTLKQVAFINASSANLTALLQAVIDNQRGNMYFGADPHNGKLGFYSVPLSQTLDNSAYNFVTIAPDPDNRNSESQVVIWNGLVYVLTCSGYVDGTAQGIVRTRLYHSSDLVNWVMDWEVTGMNSNKGLGGYFSHITASSDYLMCGYLRNTTGVTTYRFNYISENETSWTEVNSNVTESGAEDHPTVNAISPDLFIWETSAREASNVVTPHQISVFNATSKTLTSLLQEGNGYNDRTIGIDANNLKLYIANCYDYSQGLAYPRSQILQLSWNFPIETPQYLLDDQSQPNPSPTPSPSVTPTPQPTATPTASPIPTDSPTPTPTPSLSPAPTPSPTVSPTPTPIPSSSPTASPSPSPTPTASPSPSPSPTPSPTPAPKSLSDSIKTNKSSYSGSSTVTITVTVKDASNGALLRGASVTVKIINPTGSTASTFNGITGSSGTVQFNYQLGQRPVKGTWTISSTASLSGYQSGVGQTNFTVN